nr:hypothetical protein [Tanacetum cinerariifolium]
MAQQVIPAAQLVPKYLPIGRCNNYAVLQSIPSSPKCKIVGHILLDHPLSYALTVTADVHVVIEEDYHSVKDDVPLVSVYTTENVMVRGMLILNAFLTDKIRATDDFKEYETVFMKVDVPMNQPQPDVSTQGTNRSTPRALRSPTVSASNPQGKKRKQVLEPGSHKENPKIIDDDDKVKENVEEKNNDEMGSLEIRMCRRQGYMIQNMERKCVKTNQFWKTHKKINQVLRQGVSQLVEKAIEDLIESNLKPSIVKSMIEDRDAYRSKLPSLISKEFNEYAPKIIKDLFKSYVQTNVIHIHAVTSTSTDTTSSADLQHQLYLKMKYSLQDRANDIALWEVLKDDAPPEGEKRVKRHKSSKSSKSARDAWEEENVIDEDEEILEDESPELIAEFQNVDKHVPTIFDRPRMEATLKDILNPSNEMGDLSGPVVAGIDLNHGNLKGVLVNELSLLTDMSLLHLNSNRFSGEIPQNLANSPASVINLANNKLTGSIPLNVGYASSKLKEILFLNNHLTGCIPQGIGLWSDVQVFDASFNSLMGHLPDTISCLEDIEVLNVAHNKLSVFDASFNSLMGHLPDTISCLEDIEILNVAHNKLSGELPDLVCELRSLLQFSVAYNFISGFSQECTKLYDKNVGFDLALNCIPGLEMQRPQPECSLIPGDGLSCLRLPSIRPLACGTLLQSLNSSAP